ncbi:MAG TPA: TonB-dependent receptor [Vicinamibacterales bacterium]|nr:TonB-dependent receptor [Vicinamibacterales bacterium]
MRKCVLRLGIVIGLLLSAASAGAQDYRARVQGAVLDQSRAALPGVTVTLSNDATGVATTRVTDGQGRYIFDFVDPGTYTVTAELEGFSRAEQKNVRVQQRGDVTVELVLAIGTLEETVTVEAPPVMTQFNTSSVELTLEKELIDQVPISGRNPYSLSVMDPTLTLVAGNPNENRPYHHAYANEYDAGGGTQRRNDVLLDGVPLGASYKTSYTPSMDAVEEITISKNSVDAENGNSLGGVISLNMKSGTNNFHGSGYYFGRDPSLNSISDPTVRIPPGADMRSLKGTELKMYGATFGGPIRKNKIFTFTSFEQWDDNKPITRTMTVPTELERRGDFSQSVYNGRVRTVYNPWSSVLNAQGRVVRTPFSGNVIPQSMFDPVAVKLLEQLPLPNQPGNVDNWQGTVTEKADYWNLSQRVDVNLSDSVKIFARYGQFKANLFQDNPTSAKLFPLSGSNRYGMSVAGDVVWIMSNRTTLNVRGSYYNMTDEFGNDQILLGRDGLEQLWPGNSWYQSLYASPYVYYPAVDVSVAAPLAADRLGRQGREWFQRPDAWTASARMNRYEGRHSMKWGGELRAYYGEAARFEPINLQFRAALTANSSDSPDVVNSGNQWATFLLGAMDANSSARLVPLQTPNLMSYAAYFQDDFRINDRFTLNLGLRWEYGPGATDPDYRLSQQLDLTDPIPEMQATPPNMPAQALDLMASKGYGYTYNGAWIFTSKDNPRIWKISPWNFLPRVGANYRLGDDSVIRVSWARFLMPTSNIRETLGAFVDQYAGFSQVTAALAPLNGVPQQRLSNPFPDDVNPVIEPYGQTLGRYTNLGGPANLDQYEQKPQINDRINLSYQKEILAGTIVDLNYFFNFGHRLPYDTQYNCTSVACAINLNMMDPAFRYEYGTLINRTVNNPFYRYLTPDKFPGALRNQRTVTLASLLVPYPQYTQIVQYNTSGRKMLTHTFEIRAQRPFTKGASFLVAYAYNHEKRQEWFDDLHQYEVLTSGGESGWEWRPTNTPRHRVTATLSWQLPIGRDRKFLSDIPTALDYAIGGWQYTASTRYYSGQLLLFNNTYLVSGDPTLDDPTRDRWFDTTKFAVADQYTPRSNPWFFDGLRGPGTFVTDMTLTKMFQLTPKYRLEARIEAYNAFNQIVWQNPDLTLGSANFGRVTRQQIGQPGREIQIGARFIF